MIEDMTHLKVIHDLAKELQANLIEYNRRTDGITDKKTLIALRLEQSDALTEILRKQRRHLKYMNGEPIEPENHHVQAILKGFGGVRAS